MKDKIIKFLKNKNIWIIGIVIFLMLMYILVQTNVNKKTSNLEEWDEIQVEENNDETQENGEEPQENDEETQESGKEPQENNEEQKNEIKENEDEKIYVYITGEVVNPGVVILNCGSRIVDAIDAAGGVTDGANITKVNLVYVLQDGMKVNIPSNKDLKENENFEYITMSSGDERNDANLNSASLSSSDELKTNNESAFKIDVVNINTATQTELETLPGIGPSLALKIINYRKENGKFSSIEDIKNVSGIGDSKYESIKDYIKV